MTAPTYYLVCLHEPCVQEGADFIAQSLTKSDIEGGANLLVRQEKVGAQNDGLILHVTASPNRLYEIATQMEIKIKDREGVIRPFQESQLSDFAPVGHVGPLSLADVQTCILYAMEIVHFDKDQRFLPGHPDKKIMSQSPVLASYQEAGLIDMFPLHDDEELRKLHGLWSSKSFLDPPVAEIKNYYGANVALYISFTSFYTMFLIPMAFFGLLHWFLDWFLRFDFIYNNILFACFNLVAVTIFLELWKRRSNELSFEFGTMGKLRHKRPRPAFRGEFGLNPVTGREEIQYPYKNTMKTLFLISIPATALCLIVAFSMMLLSFETEKWMTEWIGDDTSLVCQAMAYLPGVAYSVLVLVMNLKYLHFAHWLTELENHRTQEQFERHVVAKLILFEFVNTFLALFYIAFYLRDVSMVKSQLQTQLIVTQIVNQLQETALPIVLKRPSSKKIMNKISKKISKGGKNSKIQCQHRQLEYIECLDCDDFEVERGLFSLEKDPFDR